MLSRVSSSFLRKSKASWSVGAIGSVRNLNVHEHISMEVFNKHGISTPGGEVAFTAEEAKEAYKKMGSRKLLTRLEATPIIYYISHCHLLIILLTHN
jgi:hypothetical protein